MCGRFNRLSSAEEVGGRFSVEPLPEAGVIEFNIAPTQPVPVIIESDGRRMIVCRWGLVPGWAKDTSMASRLINARAETLAENPSFREALASRRCLVPASGFYEWPKRGECAGKIIEVRRRDGEMFAFAGLWEEWRSSQVAGGGGEALVVRTFTIITVPPNDLISPYHDRMPAILSREDEAAWIGRSTRVGELGRLLRGYSPDELEVVAVSRERLTGGKS